MRVKRNVPLLAISSILSLNPVPIGAEEETGAVRDGVSWVPFFPSGTPGTVLFFPSTARRRTCSSDGSVPKEDSVQASNRVTVEKSPSALRRQRTRARSASALRGERGKKKN